MRLIRLTLTLAFALAAASQAPAQGQTPAQKQAQKQPPAQDTRTRKAGPSSTSMAPIEQYLMADPQAEIALARSAAPAAISGGATVLVLGRRGYETAVKGTNGFVCKVDRQWQAPFLVEDFWNPGVRAPVCLNPQAVRSVLPVNQRRTELALAGVSKAEMEVRMKSAFDKKEFGPPEPGAMSYMMSKGQRLDAGNEPPHVMFYVPGAVVDADWGANTAKSPIVGGGAPGDAREPQITFVVMVTHWSDGTPVTATAHHEQK